MKKFRILLATVLVLALSFNPVVTEAHSCTQMLYDFNVEAPLSIESFYLSYGYNTSNFSYYPNVGNSLTVRFDGDCNNYSGTAKVRLYCYNESTEECVGSKSLYGKTFQYATFTGLSTSDTYYFVLAGAKQYEIVGNLLISEDGLYPYKAQL